MTNRYPGTCANCGTRVPANSGTCVKADGQWVVLHADGQCADLDAAGDLPDPATEAGMYRTPDGTFYKVQISKQSGRAYAKRLIVDDCGHVEFEYASGAIFDITADMKLTAEQAADFGHLYGTCCWCGIALGLGDDKRGAYVGYGSTCAKNNGWPFPTVKEFKAILAAQVQPCLV
jgi:hypothetical protein